MQVPKTHREVCPAYGVPEIGTVFNGTGSFCERQRRELLGGSWGMYKHVFFCSLACES